MTTRGSLAARVTALEEQLPEADAYLVSYLVGSDNRAVLAEVERAIAAAARWSQERSRLEAERLRARSAVSA